MLHWGRADGHPTDSTRDGQGRPRPTFSDLTNSPMKLGIFGGSFDPVHRGHLTLAACCQEQARLDKVWFIPAAHQPFKPGGPFAANADRLAMLELALADSPQFEISRLEVDRGGMSYMVDTLSHIHALQPEVQLFLLMGADTLADFPFWRRPADICRLATPLVVDRAGEPAANFEHLLEFVSEERANEIAQHRVDMPRKQISSTEIRKLITAGGEWQEMVPDAVADYIQTHGLYR